MIKLNKILEIKKRVDEEYHDTNDNFEELEKTMQRSEVSEKLDRLEAKQEILKEVLALYKDEL